VRCANWKSKIAKAGRTDVLECSYGWWQSQIGVYEIDAKPHPFLPPFQGALALALPRPEGLGYSF